MIRSILQDVKEILSEACKIVIYIFFLLFKYLQKIINYLNTDNKNILCEMYDMTTKIGWGIMEVYQYKVIKICY